MISVEEYLKELKQYGTLLDNQAKVVSELPELPEWAELYDLSIVKPGELRIDIPFDVKKLSYLVKHLGPSWRHSGQGGPTNQGTIWHMYKHKVFGTELTIGLSVSVKGSACYLVQVGERTEPVYEVRCDEA